MLAGGQQGSVLEGLGKMRLGDSSWVILLPDHGFMPQQVPSCLCTHLGRSQGPCARWLQAAPTVWGSRILHS